MNPEVSDDERAEAHQRARPRTVVIYEAIREEGEDELQRSAWGTGWSAFAAGLSMTLGLIAMGGFASHLPDAKWRPLVVGLGYPLGYLIVILGRQQLFTENTLTPLLPFLTAPSWDKLLGVGRIWLIVLCGNILGAFLGATALSLTHPLPEGADAAMADIGVTLMHHDVWTRFAQAVFAGWLIALMVWLLPLAETAGSFIIYLITYVVGIAGFAHIIAGSVEVFFAEIAGQVAWSAYPAFFVPTLLGNIVGGVTFVTLIGFAQIASESGQSRKAEPDGPKPAG